MFLHWPKHSDDQDDCVATDQPSSPDDRPPVDTGIDTHIARPARLHNYLAGGDGNFAVDREAAEYMAADLPGGVDAARAATRALGGFLERAVRYLVDEASIRQFLCAGTPIPTGQEVHEIAQRSAPGARVVYLGSDPVVLAHAHTLRRGTPEGATAYVQGTLRDPERIWEQAGTTLDLTRPVAVLLPVTLSFIPDDRDPYGIVTRLLEALPAGSYLVIAHTTNDIPTEGMAEAAKRLDETLGEPYVVRSRAETTRFFDGLDLVEPGIVQIDDWQPPGDVPTPEVLAPIYAAVGRTT